MKKVLLATAALLVLIASGVAVAPGFINWSQYRSSVTALLHDLTGYDYAIDGPLNVRLLPRPHLVIHELSIEAAPGTKGPLLAVDRADISIAFLPLFTGHLIVRSVELEKPALRLEIAANGAASWINPGVQSKLDQLQRRAQNGGGGKGNFNGTIAVRAVDISDGEILFVDHRAESSRLLDHVNFTIRADQPTGPYHTSGTALYNKQPVNITVTANALDAKTLNLPTQITIDMPTQDAKLTLAGATTLKAAPEFLGEADFSTRSLASFLNWFNGAKSVVALDQSFATKGMLSAAASQLAYKNAQFTLGGTQLAGRVTLSGLNQNRQPPTADISLVDAKPLDLTAWFMPPSAPVNASKTDKTGMPPPIRTTHFLPSSLLLPAVWNATVALTAPAVTIQKFTATAFTSNLVLKEHQLTGQLNGALAGNGSANIAFGLNGLLEPSAGGGMLTIDNPQFSYKLDAKTTGGDATLAQFFAPDAKFPAGTQGAWHLLATGALKSASIEVAQGTLTGPQSTINFTGAYNTATSHTRTAIRLAAMTDHLDLDQWFGLSKPIVPAAVTPAINTAKLKDSFITKLALPFDFDLSASAHTVRFKGADYDQVNLLATLMGWQLNVKTFEASDRAGGSLLVAGTIGDITTLHDIDISIQGKTANLKKLLVSFMPARGNLPDALTDATMLAEAKGQPDNLALTANVKAMDGSIDLSGTLTDALGKPNLTALTIRLKHPNYVQVMQLLDPTFHSGVAIRKSLDLFATMNQAKGVYVIKGAQGTIGPATFAGDITVDMTKPVPQIFSKLQLGNVPLDQLLGRDAVSQAAAAQQQTLAPALGIDRWSRVPFQAAWLRQYNMTLDATAQSLAYGVWQLNSATVAATLHDGLLSVNKLDGTLYGGHAALAAQITAPDKTGGPLTIAGKASMQNADLASFVTAFTGAPILRAKGGVSLDATLQSAGISMADFVGNMVGTGKLTGKNIVLGGIDLARLSSTVANPPPGGRIDLSVLTGGATDFSGLDGTFAVKDGVIAIKPLTMTGAVASLSAPATINLPQWTIDMESTITLAKPPNAPPLQLTFRGPLNQPVKNFGGNAPTAYAGNLQPVSPAAASAPTPALAAPPVVIRSANSPSVRTMATPLIPPQQSAMLPVTTPQPAPTPVVTTPAPAVVTPAPPALSPITTAPVSHSAL